MNASRIESGPFANRDHAAYNPRPHQWSDFDVPYRVVQDLRKAPSKGGYMHAAIIGLYDNENVRD